jgi:hypothetical protein
VSMWGLAVCCHCEAARTLFMPLHNLPSRVSKTLRRYHGSSG